MNKDKRKNYFSQNISYSDGKSKDFILQAEVKIILVFIIFTFENIHECAPG